MPWGSSYKPKDYCFSLYKAANSLTFMKRFQAIIMKNAQVFTVCRSILTVKRFDLLIGEQGWYSIESEGVGAVVTALASHPGLLPMCPGFDSRTPGARFSKDPVT